MAQRQLAWRPFFRRQLTATQAATTPITFVGAGSNDDGTYDDWDTNLTEKGETPPGWYQRLDGCGWQIGLSSTPADVRDALIKIFNGALFQIEVDGFPVLPWCPVRDFPGGSGLMVESQDLVTAGRDLWGTLGSPDPDSMQQFDPPIEMDARGKGEGGHGKAIKWKVQLKLETIMALTTGNTLDVTWTGRGFEDQGAIAG